MGSFGSRVWVLGLWVLHLGLWGLAFWLSTTATMDDFTVEAGHTFRIVPCSQRGSSGFALAALGSGAQVLEVYILQGLAWGFGFNA